MNELSAAVLKEQLKKIDWIIKDIKKNKAKIKKGISDIDGITFRRLNDPAGEAGISLVFFTKKPSQALTFKKALRAENIWTTSGSYPAVVYDPSINDGHVFMHWGHIFKGIQQGQQEVPGEHRPPEPERSTSTSARSSRTRT